MRASTSDIYGVLGSILVEQKKGQRPLKFSVDRETLHCLSTDQEKAMKELTEVNSSTVDSVPPPKRGRGRKPKKSKKAAPSDGEQFDFSPNIPGNATPVPPTTQSVVPDSKSLIYTQVVSSRKFSANLPPPPSAPDDFSPSLQPPGPVSETRPVMGTVMHTLPQPEADNVHGARLTLSSPQTAKRKDRVDDSKSSSPPLPKKRKKDKPAPAVKKQNAKKSAKNGQTMAVEAGASGALASSSTAPAAVAKGNAKPLPAPRERSQR